MILNGWRAWVWTDSAASQLVAGWGCLRSKQHSWSTPPARRFPPVTHKSAARRSLRTSNLLDTLETQIKLADQQLERLLRLTAFAVLTSTPGWAAIRAASYGAAIGDAGRWPSASKV